MQEDIYYVSEYDEDKPFFINIAGVSYCDGSYHIVRKNASIFCIEYIIEGQGTVIHDGKTYHPKKGDVYMLQIGQDHDYFSDMQNPWTKVWFNAGGILIDHLIGAYGLSNKVVFENCDAKHHFDEVISLCKSNATEKEINSKAEIILHRLLQQLFDSTQNARDYPSHEALLMKSFIDRHLNENVSIDGLAQQIYRSKSQAIRIFKAAFHKTPYDYLIQQRFLQAKALLRSTNLPIKEIAFRLGFCDEHYFSYLFKQKFDVSPTVFRGL